VAVQRTRNALESARASLRGTPGQLRVAGIASVIACLAFAALAGWALQQRASSLVQAQAHADQLVRIQQIASDVVAADSQFTNGYLTFGQDSTTQLAEYDQAVSDASRLIATAAQAEPADAAELASVNEALGTYTARVASARANNKQGFQVGVGYLRQASSLLQAKSPPTMLPTLNRLVSDNATRVDDAFSTSRMATWLLVLAGLLGLGVLLVAQFRVALRSHRFLNVPLVTATAAVLVALIAGGAAMATAQSRADQVKDKSYAATLALANARISAYVGKSYQSITLIYIGTGGDYPTSQKAYQGQVDTAKAKLAAAATATGGGVGSAELAAWTAASDKLYTTAQSNWQAAAGQATQTAAGSVNALFTAFDDATRPALTTQVSAVDDGLGGMHGLLIVLAWAAVLLGVLAAGAAWLGISLRLEEYR
jgi:hypothetical protein